MQLLQTNQEGLEILLECPLLDTEEATHTYTYTLIYKNQAYFIGNKLTHYFQHYSLVSITWSAEPTSLLVKGSQSLYIEYMVRPENIARLTVIHNPTIFTYNDLNTAAEQMKELI